jgi:hypothetical protein
MRKSIRLSLLAAAGVAALALAGSAFAATFKPDLWASNYDPGLGQSFELALGANDVAVAKATIYVAPGDVVSLPGGAVGDDIGDVNASVKALALGGAVLTLPGDIKVANPASFANNQCSPGTHEAVWLLVLTAPSGPPLQVPMYIDTGSSPFTGLGSYQIAVCLPSPYIPPDQGGATFGAKLIRATLSVNNFQSAVPGRWTALVTPWVEGTGTVNPLGTVETQSIVSQAKISNFKAKRIVKHTRRIVRRIVVKKNKYFAKISGVVKENGQGTAAKVALYTVGKKGLKIVAQRTSRASGKFSFKKRLKKRTQFVVIASKKDGHQNPPQCVPDLNIGFGALPCTSVSTSGFQTFKVTKVFKVPKKH